MKFSKAIAGLGAILAFSLPVACSGDDTTISSPSAPEATDAPEVTVEETTSPTTAAPTTVEATTPPTDPAPDFSYSLDSVALSCDPNPNDCTGPIPADFPKEAQNPNHLESATFADVLALKAGDAVCYHTPNGAVDVTIFVEEAAPVPFAIKSLGGGEPYVGIRLDDGGGMPWDNAYLSGVIPAPNGDDWADVGYFYTIGVC